MYLFQISFVFCFLLSFHHTFPLIYPSVCNHSSIYSSINLSIIRPFICLSIPVSVHPSVWLSIHSSIHPSINWFIHPYILEHPLIGMVIWKCVFLTFADRDITLCWHQVNEKVDSAAKCVLELSLAKVGVSYNDFKNKINHYIGMVQLRIRFILSRQSWEIDSPIAVLEWWGFLCRAHIGHTHLTHSYILRKDPPPQCEHCQCILTVRHILVECNHLA